MIKERILSGLYDNEIDPSYLLNEQNDDGSFKTVDYYTEKRDIWYPSLHLKNILLMQKACYSPDNLQYMNKQLTDGVNLAITYWAEKNFYCEWNNWWNEIGTMLDLADIMLFPNIGLKNDIIEKLVKNLEKQTLKAEVKNRRIREREVMSTGGNLTDKVVFSLKVALIQNDIKSILWYKSLMENELRPFPNRKLFSHRYDVEGIKADMSFMQHFDLLYFGGYGIVFCDGMNDYIKWTKDTDFQLSTKSLNTYADFILDGMQYAMRGNYRDINASGRSIVRNDNLAKIRESVITACNVLSEYKDIDRKEELIALTNTRTINNDKGVGKFKYFWCTDYAVYNGQKYMTSIRAASKRTKNSEALNGENILGHYLGSGANFYYIDGNEYSNILSLLNWNRVPGTTSRQGFLPIGGDNTYSRMGKTHFVGGVEFNNSGIFCIDYNDNGVKAKKTWFIFNDCVVALGAGIKSHKSENILTCINQTSSEDTLICVDGKIMNLDNFSGKADWVYNGKIGYLTKNKLHAISEFREGDRKTISDRVESEKICGDIFELCINHGKNPRGAEYNYTVLPNVTTDELNDYINNSNYITLCNTKKIQALWNKASSTLFAVFYNKGKIRTPLGDTISVSKGTVLIYNPSELIIGNPNQKSAVIKIKINDKEYITRFKKGIYCGKPISILL